LANKKILTFQSTFIHELFFKLFILQEIQIQNQSHLIAKVITGVGKTARNPLAIPHARHHELPILEKLLSAVLELSLLVHVEWTELGSSSGSGIIVRLRRSLIRTHF
jgi:hypothetical protein